MVHNFYGFSAPSGENAAFLAESDLLRKHHHQVFEFTRHSDEIRDRGAVGTLRGALATPWNPFSVRELRRVLEQEKPDVLHVHNTFPLLSPAVFHAANGNGAATVFTLHNYRTFCAAGIPMRNLRPCTECLDGRSVVPALKYGCYRGSRAATIPMAAMIAVHRRIDTWRKHVDAFIALSSFQREQMVGAGLPPERVYVKPHFYSAPPMPLPWNEREPKVVFIGRLGTEKGVDFLIEAWKRWGADAPPLEIIGDGPEKSTLEKSVQEAGLGSTVKLLGQLPFSEVQKRLAMARLLVLPSLCFEGFPMVIREAFALGVPVAASRIGSLPCIVVDGENGALFAPGSAVDLLGTVKDLWVRPTRLSSMSVAAREEFDRKYTADKNHEMLIKIYEAAIARRKDMSSA